MNKYQIAIKAIEEQGLEKYCPFSLDEVNDAMTAKQCERFCNDGCSVDCPKFMIETLKNIERRKGGK